MPLPLLTLPFNEQEQYMPVTKICLIIIMILVYLRAKEKNGIGIAIVKKILKISSFSQLVHWETIKEQIAHRLIATLASSYFISIVSLPHDLAHETIANLTFHEFFLPSKTNKRRKENAQIKKKIYSSNKKATTTNNLYSIYIVYLTSKILMH